MRHRPYSGLVHSCVEGFVPCLCGAGVPQVINCMCGCHRSDPWGGGRTLTLVSIVTCVRIYLLYVCFWSLSLMPCLFPAKFRWSEDWCSCVEWPVPDPVQRVSPSSKHAAYMLLLQWRPLLFFPLLGDNNHKRNTGRSPQSFFSLAHSKWGPWPCNFWP